MYSFTGCPFTPPFAFRQVKYACAMFAMSVKSVPGCLVLIVPRLIGVPVAAAPGLGPHDEVLVDAVLALLEVVELAAGLELLVELLLLPQPASAARPTIAASAMTMRVGTRQRPNSRSGLPHVTTPALLLSCRRTATMSLQGPHASAQLSAYRPSRQP